VRWSWLSKPLPGRFKPQERHPVPIVQEAGWTPGLVWTGAENFILRQDLILVMGVTVEPIANHLTDFVIPAHACSFTESKRICTNMFLKSYICIVYKLKQCNCLFYHLLLNLRLLAVEVLHDDDDDQFGRGGGGGGDEDNEKDEEVVVVVVEEEEDSDS